MSIPTWPSKQDLLVHLHSKAHLDDAILVVSSLRGTHGNRHWWCGTRRGRHFIGLEVLQPPCAERDGWSYQVIDVPSLERYDEVPLSYLRNHFVAYTRELAAWMSRARAWHKDQKAIDARKAALTHGSRVHFQGAELELTDYLGAKGWRTKGVADGRPRVLSHRNLRSALAT